MLRPTDIIITNDNKIEIPVTASERQKQVLEIEHLPSLYIHSYRNGNLNRSYRALTDGTRNYKELQDSSSPLQGFHPWPMCDLWPTDAKQPLQRMSSPTILECRACTCEEGKSRKRIRCISFSLVNDSD